MISSKKLKLSKIIGLFGLVLVAFFALNSNSSCAQTPAAGACDPEYFKSLKAKAWLEAQREITQNQNLIYKPDSVLEYTCFDQQLAELADHAKDMFSENVRWGGAAVGMLDSLNTLVNASMQSYLLANFDNSIDGAYELLGGRASFDHDPPAVLTAGSYNCDVMNRVWMEAKCMDFIQNSDTDGFYTLDEYAQTDDKRLLPAICFTPVGPTGNKWPENVDTALLDPPWTPDIVNPYLDEVTHTQPADCEGALPVPTGIQVYSTAGQTYEEKICIMPGCSYSKAANKCVP